RIDERIDNFRMGRQNEGAREADASACEMQAFESVVSTVFLNNRPPRATMIQMNARTTTSMSINNNVFAESRFWQRFPGENRLNFHRPRPPHPRAASF